VVEHVIGFHDVLVLRPLGAKPIRPEDDPVVRWELTVDALFGALAPVEAVTPDRVSLLGDALTTDVLVHTWDLAKAIGVEVSLDEELCERGRLTAMVHHKKLEASDMFGPAVPVADSASAPDRLVGLFGRDPARSAPLR
jgi:uncharacterized protein (TIGR03086 family)